MADRNKFLIAIYSISIAIFAAYAAISFTFAVNYYTSCNSYIVVASIIVATALVMVCVAVWSARVHAKTYAHTVTTHRAAETGRLYDNLLNEQERRDAILQHVHFENSPQQVNYVAIYEQHRQQQMIWNLYWQHQAFMRNFAVQKAITEQAQAHANTNVNANASALVPLEQLMQQTQQLSQKLTIQQQQQQIQQQQLQLQEQLAQLQLRLPPVPAQQVSVQAPQGLLVAPYQYTYYK